MVFNTCMLFYSKSSYNCNKIRLFHLILLWWFLLSLTLLPSSISCIPTGVHEQNNATQSILCKEIERKALLTFKAGLADEGGLLSSWSADDDNRNCCNWKGVTCSNKTGHVLKLALGNSFEKYYLQGEVSSSLGDLKCLQYLDLSMNSFYPSLFPSFLSSLENLRYLNLSSTYFSGIVSPNLGNLSSLQYLDLGGNYGLKVESLQWLTGLSHLKYLKLDSVSLTKVRLDWLNAVTLLPSLLELHLSYCGLSDFSSLTNHHSVNLTSLSTLDLSCNDFGSSPTIPSWLFNLSGLVSLKLSSCFLQGSVIPNDIAKLSMLQELDLSYNTNTGGNLPASLGNLSNLVMLNLLSNGFEGRIPVTFGYLCNLRTLYLDSNNLNGEINEFFDGLERCSNNGHEHMESLSLSGNKLLGTLPSSLGSLKKVVYLDLSENSFWGSIPTTIGSLTALKTLDLSNNQMNGTIPESIGQLLELETLYLFGNLWQGVLTETHFQNHTKLQILQLSAISKGTSLVMDVRQDWLPPFTGLIGVHLDGTKMRSKKFPRWIQTLRELTWLSLKDCGILGSIPTEFWTSCTKLTYLYLSNNAISVDVSLKNLEGLLPHVRADKLEELYLDNNSLRGSEILPKVSQLAPTLSILDMSSNSLSGKIPLSMCELKHLEFLVLRDNLLTGELTHHHWEEMVNLQVLDVSNNRLVGRIPKSLGSLKGLSMLFLSRNHLKGDIPIFRNCTRLQILDIGGNNLTGKIPATFSENKLELVILRLRGNILSGTIPSGICSLSTLRTLDLAYNSFQGMIPPCLGNLSTLGKEYNYNFSSVFDYITLVSKGREYIYHGQNLRLVNLVDLSHNNLSGEIPESLMNLTAMQTLNLSMNNLTGEIPSNIGMLRMLESLDLSQNQLSGQIPPSLSDLSSISFLNLSHNNLSGRIPSSRQLQTLEGTSSYDNNPLLCGLPLPTKCPGDGTTEDRQREGEEKVEKNIKRFDLEEWGFVLSMVCGFVVGFWGACGSLAIKASWRQAYFGYLEGIKNKIIVTVVVNVARMRRKMGHITMTS